jgi:DNA helicase HerA-like ATPase
VSHRLVAAKTGWGKSWYAQAITEANAPEYPLLAVLDFKDEYRGLVEAGYAEWFIVGPDEAEWSTSRWTEFFALNPKVVLARYQLDADTWRETAGRIVAAARRLGKQEGGAFIVIEEAHHVAPEKGGYPEAIKGLATTGRGEGASSLWSTQRLALLDETPNAQADEWLFGGFTNSNDLDKIGRVVDYPQEAHNPRNGRVPMLPEELLVDGDPRSVRSFDVGAEFLYSDDRGNLDRRDTREVTMRATHYGPEGNDIRDP